MLDMLKKSAVGETTQQRLAGGSSDPPRLRKLRILTTGRAVKLLKQ